MSVSARIPATSSDLFPALQILTADLILSCAQNIRNRVLIIKLKYLWQPAYLDLIG